MLWFNKLLVQDEDCRIYKIILPYLGFFPLSFFLFLYTEKELQHLGQMRFYVSEEFIKFNYGTYNYQKQSSVW